MAKPTKTKTPAVTADEISRVRCICGDPAMGAAVELAYRKLVAAGANEADALGAIEELAHVADGIETRLAEDFGEIDKRYRIRVRGAAELQLVGGVQVREVLADAQKLAGLAEAVAGAAVNGGGDRRIAEAAAVINALCVGYVGIAERALREGRSCV